MTTVYDFEALQINGKKVALKKFKDKAMLIVNTASARRIAGRVIEIRRLVTRRATRAVAVRRPDARVLRLGSSETRRGVEITLTTAP